MSTHLGGLLLKKMTGVCWIADFRDPWTTMQEWKDEAFRSDAALRIERWLERKTVSAADGIVTTAPSVTRYFQSLLPREERGKVITITNGYDNSDFQGLPQPEANPPGMRLTHAGSLYLGRNPEPLFGALRNLIDKGAIGSCEVQVDFIGDPHYSGAPLSAMVQKHDLAQTVSLSGKMDSRACFQRLLDSRGLLLLAQDQPQEIPGKVFEYLRLNKPTLVITGEGDTKDLLLDFPNFFLADPQKPGEIEEKLLETIRHMRSKRRTGPQGGIMRYDRRALTAELSSWLSARRFS
jgi:glycosyltransferase involved in cell wall biosynthesis